MNNKKKCCLALLLAAFLWAINCAAESVGAVTNGEVNLDEVDEDIVPGTPVGIAALVSDVNKSAVGAIADGDPV